MSIFEIFHTFIFLKMSNKNVLGQYVMAGYAFKKKTPNDSIN